MEVIPVIDLKGGAVVRARLGMRATYAPLTTPLSRTSDPLDVVAGFLTIAPFRTIYAADLDAIASQGGYDGGHDDCLAALAAAFPSVTFWIDSGIGDLARARAWLAQNPRARLVLGSESLDSLACLDSLAGEERVILSLDFRDGQLLGPDGLYDAPRLWPAQIIVMSLDHVGAGSGPDTARLADAGARAPTAKFYAAGGVRGLSDLLRLNEAGICGALISTALHAGALPRVDLAVLAALADNAAASSTGARKRPACK